jgi:hypothetical protein
MRKRTHYSRRIRRYRLHLSTPALTRSTNRCSTTTLLGSRLSRSRTALDRNRSRCSRFQGWGNRRRCCTPDHSGRQRSPPRCNSSPTGNTNLRRFGSPDRSRRRRYTPGRLGSNCHCSRSYRTSSRHRCYKPGRLGSKCHCSRWPRPGSRHRCYKPRRSGKRHSITRQCSFGQGCSTARCKSARADSRCQSGYSPCSTYCFPRPCTASPPGSRILRRPGRTPDHQDSRRRRCSNRSAPRRSNNRYR